MRVVIISAALSALPSRARAFQGDLALLCNIFGGCNGWDFLIDVLRLTGLRF